MRFDRLHILRYGALTGRELAFRPDARLHVVFGRNEAGKTSILSAISDLLFGFPKAKGQDFLHEASTLRICAEIRAKDGATLSFRRRRGNKNTLLSDDEAETALREDALAPFLGSLSREVFERAFGLDSGRLRAGAKEMLKSEGELGSLLFAAATGLVGLSTLKQNLDSQADRIFAPRASKERLFYQILARHDEARRTERESELRATDWKALLASIDELKARQEAVRDKRVAARKRLNRLQMLRQLQPLVSEIDLDLGRLVAFADLADVPPGTSVELSKRLAEAGQGAEAVTAAELQIEKAKETLARIHVDEALSREKDAVYALFAQSGDYAAKQRDLPRIEAERDDYASEIVELARRLGLPAADEMERVQPSDAMLSQARELLAEGRRLGDALAALQQRNAEERQALAALERDEQSGPLIDPKPWRERFAALAPDLQAIARKPDFEAKLTRETRRLKEEAARLAPSVDDLDRLAATPLPSPETIAQHRDRLDALDRSLAGARERLAGADQELAKVEAEIARFEQGGPVPSREMIAESRRKRDARFEALADSLAGKTPALPAGQMEERIELYRLLAAEADRLADAALADAESVSRHAAHLERKADLDRARAEIEAEQARLIADQAEALTAYRTLFERSGLAPEAPARMIAWVDAVTGLLEERGELAALADEIAALDQLSESLRPVLEEIASGIATDAIRSLPTAAAARAIGDRLQALADIWAESRANAGKRDDARARIERLEAELKARTAEHKDWATRFAAALPPIGLEASATAAQADAALQLWEQLPAITRERDNRARRVAGMRRDIADFETKVAVLVGTLAPDLADLPVMMAIDGLRERADAARAASMRRREATEELVEREAQLAELRRKAAAAAEALAAMTQTLPPHPDMQALAEGLAERDRLLTELKRSRARFDELAQGEDEEAVRAALQGFDREQAAIDIEALDVEEAGLIEDMNALAADLAEKERERERLEAGAGAERAAFEKNAAEAEIVEAARQWAVLRLASTMLGQAMEKHRESHSDPMMQRAGRLFSDLTSGSFAALVQDYGEDDRPRLAGRRASGELCTIDGMSEGTRDQLYMALRLAFLEDYAERNEPAPFIGDDIFHTFDDERTAAGILTLSKASERYQPILFTHHRSVVRIAREVLGDGVDLLEL